MRRRKFLKLSIMPPTQHFKQIYQSNFHPLFEHPYFGVLKVLILLKKINVFLGCVRLLMLKWTHKGATFTINIEDLSTHKENEDL